MNDNSTGIVPNLRATVDEMNFFNNLNTSLSIASMVCASLVEVIIVAMALYDRKLIDRVSLRMCALISATDLIKSAALVVYTYANIAGGGIACKISPLFFVWSNNQYLFLTACMAYNLQHLFLMKKPYRYYYEKWYYILSIGLSFLCGFIPFLCGRYNYDGMYAYVDGNVVKLIKFDIIYFFFFQLLKEPVGSPHHIPPFLNTGNMRLFSSHLWS